MGDRVQLWLPAGAPAPLGGDRPLLLIAGRDAVAPVQAILAEAHIAGTADSTAVDAAAVLGAGVPAERTVVARIG
ncbi:hypothetical protein ACQP00_26355 [Dactylosporangium sp. CS-047395]|uniref:hypothetical protein n=1 Tax=Dactylosporangium sp. CS-047395 TaxID=3239936 RepID=UPI003D92E2E5